MKHEPGMAYKSSTLHKVFAVLSILLLFSTLGVFLDDYIRPWKGWQIKSLKIKEQKLQKDIEAAMGEISPEALKKLEEDIEKGKVLANEREAEVVEIEEKLNTLNGKIHAEKLNLSVFNGQVAALTFQWELAAEKKKPNAPKLKEQLDQNRIGFSETREKIKSYEKEARGYRKAIEAKQGELINAERAQKKLLGKIDLMKGALAKTDPMNPVWVVRNLPFIDFLDPTVKVEQVVLDNITDDRYFQQVPKVDRCMTCHTFIDKPGYEEQDQPFRTHPNLELMVGTDSIHPMSEFGCTTCHGGEGHRINDFNAAAHIPQNAEQKAEWEKKYHWHEPHKIAQPMHKLQFTEASCYKCHTGVEVVPAADKYNKGKQLVTDYGCYGCHVIPGMEHKPKPGPSLEKLTAKLDKNWVKNWIWDPFGFNPHSRMPSFFQQTNNSKPEFVEKNIAEVNAMGEFLWEQSRDFEPHMVHRGGDAERGKELIQTVGCIACHQVEGIEVSEKVGSLKAPYITGTGSKVNADWLVSWLKKPSHYQENTIMPSFRLTDREANDMTAYLMTLKNESFKDKKFAGLNKDLRDGLLFEYFVAFDTTDGAQRTLDSMSDRERTLELGKRSLGKYGCFSCHAINGFDPNRAPIGPNLSKEGSKPVHQFGFGHEKQVEHSRDGWITAHLENPRRWDKGTDKPFKDLTRMPHFYLNDEEIEYMVTYILGHTGEYVPPAGVHQLTAEEKISERGFKHIANMNCTGCHKIDGVGGDILAAYEDDENSAPPWLVDEGHRVHADWLFNFLPNVYPIRPWLEVRMPSFHYEDHAQLNEIVEHFRSAAKQPPFEPAPVRVEWEPGEKRAALALWEEFACASCHTTGFNSDEASAPNLYHSKRRLRASWIKKWLSNPQAIMPYTVMPNFFEDGESQAPDILGGDIEKQINALTKYLLEFGHNEFQWKMNKSSGNR